MCRAKLLHLPFQKNIAKEDEVAPSSQMMRMVIASVSTDLKDEEEDQEQQ